jgi:muskelin
MTLPAVQALRFLQAEVAEVADPASEEGEVLRELLAPLIGRSVPSSSVVMSPPSPVTVPVNAETYKARREVFQRLMEFFPKEAKEPSADLAEIINWYEEGRGLD